MRNRNITNCPAIRKSPLPTSKTHFFHANAFTFVSYPSTFVHMVRRNHSSVIVKFRCCNVACEGGRVCNLAWMLPLQTGGTWPVSSSEQPSEVEENPLLMKCDMNVKLPDCIPRHIQKKTFVPLVIIDCWEN